jgi:hypothetical protein
MNETLVAWRGIVGVFLVFASATKLVDRHNARAALAIHFGPRAARRLLPTLSAAEMSLGIVLISGVFPRGAFGAAAVMFGIFAGTLALWRLKGLSATCGCFGLGIPSRVTWSAVGRNGLIAVACLASAGADPHPGFSGGLAIGGIGWLVFPSLAVPLALANIGALEAIRMGRTASQHSRPALGGSGE